MLTKEKNILARNITSLFKTAQTEIQRKDKLIMSLRSPSIDLHLHDKENAEL